jgi:hypothetical protein
MTYSYVAAPKPYWQEFQDFVSLVSPSIFQFTVNTVTNTITCNINPNYYTGLSVTLSTNNTLPSPLSPSVPYYIIVIGLNNYQLATSYDNAMAGIPVDITTPGIQKQYITTEGQTYIIPLSNGKITTYSSIDHSVYKPTYTDWTGNFALPNPIVLDNTGKALIYFAINQSNLNDNYYLEIRNAIGVLMYVLDNFNATSGGGSQPVSRGDVLNHGRNAQFTFWDLASWGQNGISIDENATFNVSVMPSVGYTEIANEWFFTKNNNNGTDIITRQTFAEATLFPDNDSIYWLQYVCSNAGTGGETYKYIYQPYDNVRTFSNESIAVSIWAQSIGGAPITLVVEAVQQFGVGGSADVVTFGFNCNLTNEFQQFQGVIAIPSMASKNIENGSRLIIRIRMPLNSTFNIGLSDYQLTQTNSVQPFYQLTVEEQQSTLTTTGKTGALQLWQDLTNLPRTWIPFQNGTIGNPSSNATIYANQEAKSLFLFYWTACNNVRCPIYNSSGVPIVRGATAEADFDANNQLAFPFPSGRTISNIGSLNFSFQFTTDGVSNILIMDLLGSENLYTGKPVKFSTTGTLPAPLNISTVYYIIATSTLGHFQLATTLSNAIGGPTGSAPVILPLTTAGTGIQTISYNETASPNELADFFGEAYHQQINSEIGPHVHLQQGETRLGNPQPGFTWTNGGFNVAQVDTFGNINAFVSQTNQYQPTLSLPYIVKL